jgi:hypothetical protein
MNYWRETSGSRNVLKFKLRLAGTDELSEQRTASAATEDDRLIPSWAKLEVWKRDRGQLLRSERLPITITHKEINILRPR